MNILLRLLLLLLVSMASGGVDVGGRFVVVHDAAVVGCDDDIIWASCMTFLVSMDVKLQVINQ